MSEATIKFHTVTEAIPVAKAFYDLVLTEQDLYDMIGPFLKRSGGPILVDGFLFSACPDDCGYLIIPCEGERLLEVTYARWVSAELSMESHLYFAKQIPEENEYLVGSPASIANQEIIKSANLEPYDNMLSVWGRPMTSLAYEVVGDHKIQIKNRESGKPYTKRVDIRFEYELCDKKGFPYIRKDQVEALAGFANLCDIQKRYYKSEVDQNRLQTAQINSGLLCDAAKAGDGINENGMAEIFKAFTSFNRFNYSSL